MNLNLSFNTHWFSEYLKRGHGGHHAINKKKIFFRKQFENIDYAVLQWIYERFMDKYKLPKQWESIFIVRIAPRLNNARIWLTLLDSTGVDTLLCWYSINTQAEFLSTLFHELTHGSGYKYVNNEEHLNYNWYMQMEKMFPHYVGIDEGMTDLLAGELFHVYCREKWLAHEYEYFYIRELYTIKKLIIFLAKKCNMTREEVKAILFSWYFQWIHIDDTGKSQSIQSALTSKTGIFRMTDEEVRKILGNTIQ